MDREERWALIKSLLKEGGDVQENNCRRTKGAGSTRSQGKTEPEEKRKAGGDVNAD
jgi:hypothetical protein